MPWFYVDDGFSDSKPVLNMPDRYRLAACGLWVLAGAWSAKEETDGHIPEAKLIQLGATPKLIETLTSGDNALWQRDDKSASITRRHVGNNSFKSWSKWQKTRDELVAKRAADAERQKSHRRKGRDYVASGDAEMSRCDTSVTEEECHAVTNALVTPDVTVLVTRDPRARAPRPDPTLTKRTKEQDTRASDSTPNEPASTTRDQPPNRFTDFWAEYPLRRDKGKAAKAYARALKRATPDQIIEGARRYAADPNREDRFTKYAEGWLNGDGWLDEPLPARNGHQVHKLRAVAQLAAQVRAQENSERKAIK